MWYSNSILATPGFVLTSQNFEAVQQENLHNTIWNEFLNISRLNSSNIQYETVFLYVTIQNGFVIVLFEDQILLRHPCPRSDPKVIHK